MKHTKPFALASMALASLLTGQSALADFIVAESSTGNAELYSSEGVHAGTFATGLIAPIGVAVGGGNIYISEYGDSVKKYSTTGTAMGVVNSATQPFNHGPAGLAYINGRIHNAAFNISYLTSSAPDAETEDGDPATPLPYLFYTPFSGSVHGVASAEPNGFSDIIYYTGYQNDFDNGEENPPGTSWLGYWQPGLDAGAFFNLGNTTVRGVVAAGSNTLYVAMYDLNKVVKVYFDGVFWVSEDFITDIPNPVGLVIDGGNLYVSSFSGQTITGYSLADASQVSQFMTVGLPQYFAMVTLTAEPVLPNLRIVSAGGGTATLELDAAANVAYTVQFSSTLDTGSWGLLQSVPAGLERTETITDANAPDPKRFYRASVAP